MLDSTSSPKISLLCIEASRGVDGLKRLVSPEQYASRPALVTGVSRFTPVTVFLRKSHVETGEASDLNGLANACGDVVDQRADGQIRLANRPLLEQNNGPDERPHLHVDEVLDEIFVRATCAYLVFERAATSLDELARKLVFAHRHRRGRRDMLGEIARERRELGCASAFDGLAVDFDDHAQTSVVMDVAGDDALGRATIHGAGASPELGDSPGDAAGRHGVLLIRDRK